MTDPDLSRRRALMGAAVGGLSLPLLAACGGGSSSSTTGAGASSGPSSPGGSTSDASGGATVLAPVAHVPVGGGVILASANIVLTQPTKGTFEGFSATCPHQGCQVASVAGGTINCGCHGSQFSIKDGSNVAGPNGTPAGSVGALGRIAVKAKGADIIEI